jgi:hypothetical protein
MERRKMDDIERRIEGLSAELSPEGRALMREVRRAEKEAVSGVPGVPGVPLDEIRAAGAAMVPRMEKHFQKHPEDQEKFIEIIEATIAQASDGMNRAEADSTKYEGLVEIMSRAQELDRLSGRPVNEQITLAEAVSKLEAAGKLDPLERKYLDSIQDEVLYIPPQRS